jgi:hypothetical protein
MCRRSLRHYGVVGSIADGRTVSAALDPVLTPVGFAAGQYGGGGEGRYISGQTIFCAAHDEFGNRYQWMPQANRQERGIGCCTDLVVETTKSRFDSARLEHLSLQETLRQVGHDDDAEEVSRVQGAALAEALPILGASLERLFGVPT